MVERKSRPSRKGNAGAPADKGSSPGRGRSTKPTLHIPPESSDALQPKPTSKITVDVPSDPALRSWSEPSPPSTRARRMFQIPGDRVVLQTDPAILPDKPRESGGLFELVHPIARRALSVGLSARERSFHVFVAAGPDVMIEADIVRFAEAFVRGQPAPPDLVYVHDFNRPEAPLPLVLPSGGGPKLVAMMDALIDRLSDEIPEIVNNEDVRKAQSQLVHELEVHNREIITGLEITAKTLGFGIRPVQGGVQTFPVLHGKPVSAEQFSVLDESTKKMLNEAEERLTDAVQKAADVVRKQTQQVEHVRDQALQKIAEMLVERAVKETRDACAELGSVVNGYFDQVAAALNDDWTDFVTTEESESSGDGDDEGKEQDPEHARRHNRFRVNLLVSHEAGAAPPVVYDTNPTYPNLFGYMERRARFGALLTDFTRIRAGTIHSASGGVLVVRASDLMADPIIWERIKRVLREGRIGAEDPLGPLGLYATTLRPVPVPIRVRVVLVGSPEMYAALLDADPDFAMLWRVKVEIEPSIPRVKENLIGLDAYLMAMARDREWGAFDKTARARLLDLATRLSGERDRLSLSLQPLEETAAFASSIAAVRQQELPEETPRERPSKRKEPSSPELAARRTPAARVEVTREDVDLAWQERRDRRGAAERSIRDMTLRGEVALDTTGSRVGVVNGLSVYSAGDVEFGQPMRITAVVALGREGLVDVEREAQLGGSIHTKGVAILRGYLGRMFGQERPVSLRAQIAFEQSYGEIDGDSASSTELFVVLSALADLAIDQAIAVTGSVNQLGELQTIGGVCAKIEGFFDLCRARGLTGHQGVLIPRPNLSHLVLREDVATAITQGQFHIYACETVAQGIEVLTGVPAGERDGTGRFPASSVFGRVERRIIEIAELLRQAEATHTIEPRESVDDISRADLTDGGDFRGIP